MPPDNGISELTKNIEAPHTTIPDNPEDPAFHKTRTCGEEHHEIDVALEPEETLFGERIVIAEGIDDHNAETLTDGNETELRHRDRLHDGETRKYAAVIPPVTCDNRKKVGNSTPLKTKTKVEEVFAPEETKEAGK